MDQGFEVKPGGGGVRVPLGRPSHPVPEYGTRIRYPLGTVVNTPFFKYPRQLSGIKLTTESLRAHHLF